jgi:hypothetical protein
MRRARKRPKLILFAVKDLDNDQGLMNPRVTT